MTMFPSTPIGPCEIWAGTTQALAAKICDTVGGAELTYTEEYATSKMDKTGNRARAKVVIGGECKVTGAAGEATIAQLASLTGQSADTGDTRLGLGARTGTNLRDDAQVVILKPIIEGVVSVTDADWFVIPAATFEVNWAISFTVDGQRSYGFIIEGHPVTADEVATGGRIVDEGFVENQILVLGD